MHPKRIFSTDMKTQFVYTLQITIFLLSVMSIEWEKQPCLPYYLFHCYIALFQFITVFSLIEVL